jgi:hypothetical protein
MMVCSGLSGLATALVTPNGKVAISEVSNRSRLLV